MGPPVASYVPLVSSPNGEHSTKAYQYIALDDRTRLRVLLLYRQLNVRSSLEFLSEIVRVFPFPIRRLQTDRGTEFRSRSCWPSNAVHPDEESHPVRRRHDDTRSYRAHARQRARPLCAS